MGSYIDEGFYKDSDPIYPRRILDNDPKKVEEKNKKFKIPV